MSSTGSPWRDDKVSDSVERVGSSLLFIECSDMKVGPAFRAGNRGTTNCRREKGVLGDIVETRTADIGVTPRGKRITVIN